MRLAALARASIPVLLTIAACDGASRRSQLVNAPSTDTAPLSSSPSPSPSPSLAPRAAAIADDMVAIPAGTYWMGSADGVGDADEHPRHEASVLSFSMDLTEVTVAAYDACVRAGACTGVGTTVLCNAGKVGLASLPINCVDWNQATAYCRWAGKRLPTEEEWEYAAVGTDGRIYPWGNEAPSNQLCWRRWTGDQNTSLGACAVGTYPLGDSAFGLHDMAGNVREWVASGYSTRYDGPRSRELCIARGGSWNDIDAPRVRGAERNMETPASRLSFLGFRCAR